MNAAKAKRDGRLDGDFLGDLRYLDMVSAETLRKYPPPVTLFREAARDYRAPDVASAIEKGTEALIHYDHRYYADPQTFDRKAKRPSGTYVPFGHGPRVRRIGKRFAEMEMKLTELLTTYEFEPCDKTDIPMRFGKRSLIVIPENGIRLKFKPIPSTA